MKLLFWVTSMNGEILALLRYVLNKTRHQVLVAHDTWDSFQKEPHQKLVPINPPKVIPRSKPIGYYEALKFNPDVLIVDNALPKLPIAQNILIVWHGWGWKRIADHEFKHYSSKLSLLIGSPRKINPNFLWKAYGKRDETYLNKLGLHKDNIIPLGMLAGEDIDYIVPKITKKDAQPFYPIDITQKVVLLAPTWHYGGIFSHWGNELQMLDKLFNHLKEHCASVILRLHDKKRYHIDFIKQLENISKSYGNVYLKYKNLGEDNLVDIAVSDLMITNYSSIANLFYATGKPTIHIYPTKKGNDSIVFRKFDGTTMKLVGKVQLRNFMKTSINETGGPIAYDMQEMLSFIDQALQDPFKWKSNGFTYLDEFMTKWDKGVCKKTINFIEKYFNNKKTRFPILNLVSLNKIKDAISEHIIKY